MEQQQRGAAEDVDTCRICRGEASLSEPLFHPCKCSGSIMYVHQECLMTWLSHSQKKHCELCKTNFRFTKLYSPRMPEKLPTGIFFRRAALHVLASFLYWLRALLVSATWLVWLPWSMRFVWWTLLWIADAGWATDGLQPQVARNVSPASATPSTFTFSVFRVLNVTVAAVPRLRLPSRRLWDFAAGAPSAAHSAQLSPDGAGTLNSANSIAPLSRSSLLSEVSFFQNLTSYPLLNSFVIDVVEGQVITFSILTAVVLIFLIREWVVQQQPAVNWAAANDLLQGENDGPVGVEQNQAEAVAGDEQNAQPVPAGPAESEALDFAVDDLEPPVPSFADRDDTLPEGVEDDPPLWLAEEHSVRELLNHLETYRDEVARLAEPDDIPAGASRPRRIAQDLVLHIYSTHIAIGRACVVAYNSSDFETLAQLHERLLRLDNALSLLGDTADRHKLAARVGHFRRWTSRVLERRGQQEGSGKGLRPARTSMVPLGHADSAEGADQNASTGSAASSSTATGSDASQSTRGRDEQPRELDATRAATSPRVRPSMPVRNESFIATEVHRDLEESLTAPVRGSDGRGTSHEAEPRQEANAGVERVAQQHASHSVSSSDSFSLLDADVGASQSGPVSPPNQTGSHASDVAEPRQDASTDGQPRSSSNPQADGGRAAQDQAPRGIYRRLSDWMWGEVPADVTDETGRAADDDDDDDDDDDEDAFQVLADAPDARPEHRDGDEDEDNDRQGDARLDNDDAANDDDDHAPVLAPEQELERAIAQAQGANDNEADAAAAAAAAAEDIEDLEGLMELIGMQGNIVGLFQNAVFMAVIGAAAITMSIWFPYLWGKLVLVFVAHPLHVAVRLPLELLSGTTNLIIDLAIWTGASTLQFIDACLVLVYALWQLWSSPGIKFRGDTAVGRYSGQAAQQAVARISKLFMEPSDYIHLSASSHASLRQLQAGVSSLLDGTKTTCVALYRQWTDGEGVGFRDGACMLALNLQSAGEAVWSSARSALGGLVRPAANLTWTNAMTVQIQSSSPKTPLDLGSAIWTGGDRTMAVLAGYAFFIGLGAVYLTRFAPLATTRQAKKIEDGIVDVLQQAGGIMKVIIIISIEMLLFPVYCGALLDVATLPLFRGHTVEHRVRFTLDSPWTSAYTHWFIGTCYMFHLALFVSMCRKILRPGTIYFIRDPDDPTFHPVRDVLERNLASQMRKIVASATVYGGLVILFMGGVVWCLAATGWGVLPIRWSSSGHVRGFPVDLLLYTALKPVAVGMWSPSSALHALYTWWFGVFAAALRLRSFLLGGDMQADRRPWTTAGGAGAGGAGGAGAAATSADRNTTRGQGRFVRVPNSDQARIPRGGSVFLEVDAENNRLDGAADHDEGTHGRRDVNFTMVYVPPHFRLRVVLFILCLYALTAAVGLGLSVAPLLVGRLAFSLVLPPGAHVTDIYAFVLGLCPIVAVAYAEPRASRILSLLRRHAPDRHSLTDTARRLGQSVGYAARFVYTYTALFVVLPSLLVLVLDFYMVGPAHAYLAGPGQARTVHLLQSWTLGIQYLRIVKCIVEWNPDSRPARAMNAVMQRGWRDPNAGLVTRGFVLPIALLTFLALAGPLPLAWLASRLLYTSDEADSRVQLLRFVYPAILAVGVMLWMARLLLGALEHWRLRIRDEVYLIGERLHNFGETKPPTFAHSSTTRISHA